MKRIIIFIAIIANALAIYANMSNSIEYNHLYIVGDAIETSWDLGKAPDMVKISDGVFEWTGNLSANKEFKFMNSKDGWHKHIVSAQNLSEIIPEMVYPLNFFADWTLDGKKDLKFKVSESGLYTVTVDLTSMRMKVSKSNLAQSAWPEKFYIVGSATDNEIIEIPDYYNVEHKKSIYLRPGFLKIIDTPQINSQTKFYAPRFPEVDITFGRNSNVFLYQTDENNNGWSVSIPGDYLIYLDNSKHNFMSKRFNQYKTLYIVGGCCRHAWNYIEDSEIRFYPDSDNPDLMVWEGELRIGWNKKDDGSNPDEPDRFKILTAQDWFADTFHPYQSDAPAEGISDARISGGDDLKWTIRKDGFYRIELDTKHETLKAVCIDNDDSVSERQAADINPIYSIPPVDSDVLLFNLQGLQVKNPTNGIFIIKQGDSVNKVIIK